MRSACWRIVLASEVGTSHSASGAPCQDSAAHALVDTPKGVVLIVAVSDGAGSAPHSDVGSSVAVATFVSEVKGFLESGSEVSDIDNARAAKWVDAASAATIAIAESNGHQPRDYSCTLLGAVVGEANSAFLQVGDGAIVVSHGDDDGWSYVFWPQHGEFANTTNFIQSADMASVIAFDLAERRINEFAIFSDGIENLVLHRASRTVQQTFFTSMIEPVRNSTAPGLDQDLSVGLHQYLSSPTICNRTDDDKTLVLATRTVGPTLNDEPTANY
jgi:hypothetical protein